MTRPRAAELVFRDESGGVLATLLAELRDFGAAEDALQDASLAALEQWPEQGTPASPGAWLLTVARRKALDRARRERSLEDRHAGLERERQALLVESVTEDAATGDDPVDHRLSLFFTCCHPALAEPARVALTLQTLGGLSTGEVARAFLVKEAAMAQRLVRAKRKIQDAGIPYRVPPAEERPERMQSVLQAVYLIFNEGWAATSGDALVRTELCRDALRLAELLVDLVPGDVGDAEAAGLLALLLFTDARRATRASAAGDFVPLEEQDRSLWDRSLIVRADALLRATLVRGEVGPYQLQAAISGLHALAPSWEATDWNEMVGLYAELERRSTSPVVRLNAAVARSWRDGPDAALALLAELEEHATLADYQPYHAARADLLRRAGRPHDAAAAYGRALELTHNAAERRFLEARLEGLALG